MANEQEHRKLSPGDAEITLKFFKDQLQDTVNFLNTLTTVYYNMSLTANQLNSNAFAHRSEVDDAVDRTVDIGHALDKLIKQTELLLREYQAALLVDQVVFVEQIKKGEF